MRGLAHDFANLQGVILGYCEMICGTAQRRSMIEPDSDAFRYVQNIGEAARRSMALSTRMFSTTSTTTDGQDAIDVNSLLAAEVEFLGRDLQRAGIEVRLKLAADLPLLRIVDALELKRVILNLAMNAKEALDGRAGGRIRFGTLAGEDLGVWIVVADNGPGMTPEIAGRIFESEFSTKQSKEGHGLGLAIVKAAVDQLRGTITCVTLPGKGTTFSVFLPGG